MKIIKIYILILNLLIKLFNFINKFKSTIIILFYNNNIMTLYVVTVATHNDGYLDALKKSCENNNIKLNILGYGQKWEGFAWRFDLLNNFLQDKNDNDIILFIDAYDVIILNDINIILEKFLKYNKPIVISSENINNKINQYVYTKVFGICEYNLNAGTYIGYIYALKQMFYLLKNKYNLKSCKNDDQCLLVNFYNSNKEFVNKYITIDNESKIFYVLTHDNILNYFYNKSYKYEKIFENNKNPCIIHGPGNINMSLILDKLNLPYNKKIRNYYDYKFILNYIYFFINEIILMIFIIIILIKIYSNL